ncbi:MAG: pyruvate ferredoxin oxidoreductase [Candidatus Njordarchaeia archaeon]
MTHIDVITGNTATAWAVRLSRVEVIAAYPITPQTTIVETLASWVEQGLMDAKFIRVESEHSALAAVMGASAAGTRAFTATSSHGLWYMAEMIFWAAGARTPLVMAVVNRALAPPWNIWSDHTDALALRDAGWIQFWASNSQEVMDSIIQAYKIAEDKNVLLPAMITLGGFVLSHTSMPVEIHDQTKVDEFLPPYNPPHYVFDPHVSEPITEGNIGLPPDYMKMRLSMEKAMQNSYDVIKRVAKEFYEIFGKWHGDLVKEYKTEDAEVVIMAIGAVAEEAEAAVDEMRESGLKVGSLKIRVTRPFPFREVAKAADRASAVVVIDRDISLGWGGIVTGMVEATLKRHNVDTPVYGKVMGLGGDEITTANIKSAVMEALNK